MLTLECVMLTLGCGMLTLECGMLTLECGMLTLECGMLTLEFGMSSNSNEDISFLQQDLLCPDSDRERSVSSLRVRYSGDEL